MFDHLREDISVVFERDPAARTKWEVFTCYPGFHALLMHRLAHRLWDWELKWLARCIEIEELVFGERSTVVLDPGEERIKSEFTDVKCTMLPMHSILRIDEVKKQGQAKISALEGGNVSQFPMSMYQPSGSEPGSKK